MSMSRLQSEERYEALKAKLLENDFGELLAVQSVPLVERLLLTALEAESLRGLAEEKYERTRRDHLASEHQLLPLKEDNARLLHENNALHLELIHEAEQEDETQRLHQMSIDRLKSQVGDLQFLNLQCNQRVLAADAQSEKLQLRLQELTLSGADAKAKKPRMAMSRAVAEPGSLEAQDPNVFPQQDLVAIKEQKIAQLEAALEETTLQLNGMDVDMASFVEKLHRRDTELERLSQLLDGGQDYQKLSFEHVNKTNQQLVSSLNEQVNFLTSQIVNLENEVLHKDSIQEQSETIHADLLQKITRLQVEVQAQADERTALESETEMLKQDLNSQRELNVAAGQTSPEVTQLTRQTLATGLNEQSLRASVADPDVDSMKLASQLDSLRKEADSAAGRHHDETTALRKETTNLKTDLETTQRELARARQEQDLHQEELGRYRTEADSSNDELNKLRTGFRQSSSQLADADSVAAALRAEVSRLSSELVDKSAECRQVSAERNQLNSELQKLQIMQQDTDSLKASAATARDAASIQETQNLRLRQEQERLEEVLRSKMREEQQLRSTVDDIEEQKIGLEDKLRRVETECKRTKSNLDEVTEERDGLKMMYQQAREQLQLALDDQERRIDSSGDCEEQLRNRISELEVQVSRLTVDTAEARRQAEASRFTAQQLATESTELAKTVSQLRQGRSEVQKQADTLMLQVDSLEMKGSTQNTELERTRQACKSKQSELDQMRALFSQLDSTRAELVDTLQRDRARMEHSDKEIQVMRMENARLQAENSDQRQARETNTVSIAKLDAERDAVTRELDAKAEELASLKAAYEESSGRQLLAEKSLSDLQSQLQMQISQLDRQEAELGALRQGSQSSDLDRHSLQQELQLKTDEIVALSEDLGNMTRENQVINSELMDTASERDACRETLAAMEMRLGHADSLVATKDVEKEDIMGSYKKLHDTNVQLSAALREAEENVSRMRGEHNAMQAEVTAVRQQHVELEQHFQQQDMNAHQFRHQSDEYTRFAREMHEQLEKSRAVQQALEREAAQATSMRAAAEISLGDMQRQIAQVENEKHVAMSDKERAERSQSELQIQLQLQATRADELEQLLSTLRARSGLGGSQAAPAANEHRDGNRDSHDSAISAKLNAKLDEVRNKELHLTEELRKVQTKVSDLESKARSDEAYKMQTMQYLRKYEAELQRKEQRVQELERTVRGGH